MARRDAVRTDCAHAAASPRAPARCSYAAALRIILSAARPRATPGTRSVTLLAREAQRLRTPPANPTEASISWPEVLTDADFTYWSAIYPHAVAAGSGRVLDRSE